MQRPASSPPVMRAPARGAATLIVVMLLFFVVSLAAAYASRNMIFEQRTSANQLRSTQVLEAADSGIEWAMTMINGGAIDENCLPTNAAGATSFRQRYLNTNAVTGIVTPALNTTNAAQLLWAACSFDGVNWSCRCPTGTLAAGALPAGRAAFAVRFLAQPAGGAPTRPGLVRVEVNGCSSNDLACLRFDEGGFANFCHSTACALLSLYGGIRTLPTAALTVRQAVNGAGLQVINQDVNAGGITVHAGGPVSAGVSLVGMSGSPPATSLRENDSAAFGWLAVDSADCTQCLFSATFGLRPATYRQQLGTLEVDCTAGCTAATVNAALASQRGRVLWLRGAGGLTLSAAADSIGTAANPVVMVVDGPLTMTAAAAGATVYGAVYADSLSIGGGTVVGAAIVATNVAATGGTVVYDASVLNILRVTSGSYVRVPGGWRDHS